MGHVIVRCRTCGFDIPDGAADCPACPPATTPPLVARQVAGMALPTRSVHSLRTVRPRAEAPVRPLGPARTARSAFSITSTLAMLTILAAALTWVVRQPRFALQVPHGTEDWLDTATFYLAVASVTVMLIGLVALVVWCLRAVGRATRQVVARRPFA